MTATIPDTILNIDLADGNFYADRQTSREAYRWMRANEPYIAQVQPLEAALEAALEYSQRVARFPSAVLFGAQ